MVRTTRTLAAGAAGAGAVTMAMFGLTVHRPGAQVFSWVAAVVFAAACVRALLVGVCIRDEGVRIRGVLLTRTLKWSEIESFSFGPLGIFPAVGIVHVKAGRPVPITAIAVGRVATRVARRQAEELIAELNDALRRLGGP